MLSAGILCLLKSTACGGYSGRVHRSRFLAFDVPFPSLCPTFSFEATGKWPGLLGRQALGCMIKVLTVASGGSVVNNESRLGEEIRQKKEKSLNYDPKGELL